MMPRRGRPRQKKRRRNKKKVDQSDDEEVRKLDTIFIVISSPKTLN